MNLPVQTTRKPSSYLFYKGEDFILYVFSLLLVFAGGWLAFPFLPVRILFAATLIYLGAFFIAKHGLRLDKSCFVVIADGLKDSCSGFFSRVYLHRRMYLVFFSGFLLILLIEWILKTNNGIAPGFLASFPFMGLFFIQFIVFFAYRSVIFIAHMVKAPMVLEFLQGTVWQRQIKGISIYHHIFHAYVSSLVCFTCFFIPALIFWRFIEPTWFREISLNIMMAAVILVRYTGDIKLLRAKGISTGMFLRDIADVIRLDETRYRLGFHKRYHSSRFHFAVSHGHHHDAIPYALTGGPGSGFGESLGEGFYQVPFFRPQFLYQSVIMSVAFYIDILSHQYLPGIYPYARYVIKEQVHHFAHHFGSLSPYSLTGIYNPDIETGYQPAGRKARWFADLSKKHETIENQELDDFLNYSYGKRYAHVAEQLGIVYR